MVPKLFRKDKFKLKFELSEEQIAIKLGFYFGLLEAGLGRNFELESSNESATGADHEYQGIAARYYLQAKAPVGLRSTNAVPAHRTQEDVGMNAIRQYRSVNGLYDEPYSLCFPLRRPAKHARIPDELQHNLLYAMHDSARQSHAMYIAPTTCKKSEYLALLRDRSHWPQLRDGPFWKWNETGIFFGLETAHIFMNMPFLQAHICIVPHCRVDSHDHHYSYSIHGNDIAFHSPIILNNRSSLLSDFLGDQVIHLNRTMHQDSTSLEQVMEHLKDALPRSVIDKVGPDPQNSRMGWIRRVGTVLKADFGIHQYLVMRKKQR